MTDRMAKMCELMGIPLIDHVIVGGDNLQYFSFKEKKLMDTPKVFLETNYKSLDLSSGLVAESSHILAIRSVIIVSCLLGVRFPLG